MRQVRNVKPGHRQFLTLANGTKLLDDDEKQKYMPSGGLRQDDPDGNSSGIAKRFDSAVNECARCAEALAIVAGPE